MKSIFNSNVVKNVLTLFSGSAAAQLIPFIVLPFLVRHYSEEVFGYFFLFNSIVVILAVVSTLKFEISLVLPKVETDVKRLFLLAVITSILTTILIALGLIILKPIFESRFQLHTKLNVWYYLIPIAVWIIGLNQTFEHWLIRKEKYPVISGGKIVKAGSISSLQLFVRPLGLIGGFIIGQFLQFIWYTSRLWNDINKIPKTDLNDLKVLVKTYQKIPVFNTLAGLTNTISNQLPLLLLFYFYNVETAAFYGMAHRLIATPMGMISQSISQVFFQDASKKFNTEPQLFHSFVKRSAVNLLKLASAPFAILFILATFMVEPYLGENWLNSVMYMQVLIPWLFIGFINTPLTAITTILKKQQYFFIYDLSLLVFRLGALVTGYYIFNEATWSIGLFAMVSVLFNLVLTFILLSLSKRAV